MSSVIFLAAARAWSRCDLTSSVFYSSDDPPPPSRSAWCVHPCGYQRIRSPVATRPYRDSSRRSRRGMTTTNQGCELLAGRSDAVHDGLVARSPLSRRTSPPQGKQRPYVATTAQIWALHDAMEERYRAGLLLAAFAGLRLAEVCGLRVQDVDFMRGVVHPVQQYPADPLKTEASRWPIPIPQDLALELSRHVEDYSTTWIICDEVGHQLGPWQLQRAFRAARALASGLPEGFRFHDLRHYSASLLISSGLDVKVVQARLRHTSAKTTLDTYGHLWPDFDETTRAAISTVMTTRNGTSAATVRPI